MSRLTGSRRPCFSILLLAAIEVCLPVEEFWKKELWMHNLDGAGGGIVPMLSSEGFQIG